jgi:hypothetical protein
MLKIGISHRSDFERHKTHFFGCALSLDEFTFSFSELCSKIQIIVADKEGGFKIEKERMMRIARVP